VTDFGVAKILSQNMTLTGTMMGTPSYMSPEQVQGVPEIDGRADQFSLAVCMYEALTGEKPFAADYLPTLLFKVVREDFIAPQRLNPTLGPRVETVLRRAMAKQPSARFESCEEFIGVLTAACRATPDWAPMPRSAIQNMPTTGSIVAPKLEQTAPTTFAPVPLRRRPEPRHTVRNAMFTIAAAAAISAGAFFAIRSGGEKQIAQAENPAPEPQPQQPSSAAEPPPDASALPPETKPADDTPAPTPPPAQPAPAQPEPAQKQASRTETPRSAPAPAEPSTFELTATPAGSTAIFDNDPNLRCDTPCEIPLPPGRHTFTVSSQGYREAHRIIEIPRDTGLIVNLEKSSGTLSITSNPPGLAVSIDGKVQQRRTPAMFNVAPGRHHVEVARGAEKRESNVDVHDGGTSDLNIDWQ